MSDQFLGEIRIFAGSFAPYQWALCNGQLLAIQQNPALFSLLGTNFGGNGKTNFGLPDLRDRIPMNWGQGPGLTPRDLGELGGTPSVSLLLTEMASHGHTPNAVLAGEVASPAGATWAASSTRANRYSTVSTPAPMAQNLVDPAGGGLPHNNVSPFLVLNYIIALAGVFPTRP